MPISSPTPVASNPIVALREGGGLATPSRGGGVPNNNSAETQTPISRITKGGTTIETYPSENDVLSGKKLKAGFTEKLLRATNVINEAVADKMAKDRKEKSKLGVGCPAWWRTQCHLAARVEWRRKPEPSSKKRVM